MGHILILGEKESFIIRVLLKKMADANIEAVFTTMDLNKIHAQWADASLVTFYMEKDEVLPEDIKTFLVDNLENDNKKIILIGEPVDTAEIAAGFPGHLIYGTLPRPLDYDDYIAMVNKYASQASTGDLKKKILIVDDDPNYMSLVREWMVDDYKVSMVTSGMRAIKWLASNKVDMILLDYEMPVTNGPQVLEMLRAEEETKDIPVIFLTGNDSKESVMSVVGLKPQGYFLKTMPKDEFLNKIKVFFMQEAE
ncbi:Response regulator receiver domain-containing protein [Pseudobutyrivibrio sp. 49]|uniref:response regulator n=1 Tax=unclassified Pseudobutyrivibrio TaxID=2638619 RepID=UPI000880FFDD|nr:MULTISPECIES: response regulator [unclassified Pseudobutyrivibrio]SDH79211.1 Response regulator receiver domain-containing protein [Pseudobutyrivibrio sp. 49]SFO01731.1 Response regulator receiver domain-containing protein [Pseudobutyrivibrio sp. UC1225]